MTDQKPHMRPIPPFALAIVLALSTISCVSWLGVSQTVGPPPITQTAPLPAATPQATTQPPPPTPTTEAVEPAPPVPATPEVDWSDMEPYRESLLPGHASDTDIVPGASRYYISAGVEIPPDGGEPTIEGAVRVLYTNTEDAPLSEVYFRLYPNTRGYGGGMEVGQAVVNGREVETKSASGGSALGVPFSPPLEPGESADITLFYLAKVPTDMGHGYGIYIWYDDVMALAGFYPVVAVYDDEGWNLEVPPTYGDATYLDASLYRLRLTIPADMTVVTSGSTLERADNGDDTQTIIAAGGPVRDFYVIMSRDFKVQSGSVDGIEVNSYYRGEAPDSSGETVLKQAIDAVKVYQEHIGPYPYAELDLVASPTNAGGVEYPGAVIISQDYYLATGGWEVVFFEVVVAHEVAHQWWYNVVGNDQVDDPWMDESLTNYTAYIYWQETHDAESASEFYETMFMDSYRHAQEEDIDRGIGGPVSSYSEDDYVTIVYGKGPLFFDTLRERVGDDTFFKILGTYYERYSYRIATPEDMLSVIEEVSGEDMDDLYAEWVLGD